MSVATELTRIQTAKASLKTAIENKGVTVSSSALIDDYADLVTSIPSGGGGTLQTKTAYSGSLVSPITITPSAGYDGLSSIEILPLPDEFEGSELPDLRLFYIDSTSDSDITFYDRELNEINNIQVGDKPVFYSVNSEGTKPKYYFYASLPPMFEGLDFAWTNDENGSYNYHYYNIGDSSSFGKGRSSSSSFWANYQGLSTEGMYIWMEDLYQYMEDYYNYLNPILFIGSTAELNILKTFLTNNPSLDNPFTGNTVWSCSEISGTDAYAFVNGVQSQVDKSTPGIFIPMWSI